MQNRTNGTPSQSYLTRLWNEVNRLGGHTGLQTMKAQYGYVQQMYRAGVTAKQAAPLVIEQYQLHSSMEAYKELSA